MPETIIESVLNGKIDTALLIKWLGNESVEDNNEDSVLLCCNRSEFVIQFLSYLRNQTDNILQTNTNALQVLQHQNTPEKIIKSRRDHRRSISDPTSNERTMDSLSVKTDRQRSHESPSKDRKRTGRKVKTKLFTDDKKDQSISSDESRISSGVERMVVSSTPLKNGVKDYPNLPMTSPVTPHRSFKEHERCDTPRLSHRHSRSHEKSCLGDYIVTAQKSTKKKKVCKNTSNDDTSDSNIVLDLSNSQMFPEIGVRKSSSLRSERRRIKPTNIDKTVAQKSYSLNSFNTECFQQPSPLALEDNIAFKPQNLQPKESANSFDVERSMLKQERHKLMEKFNILSTSSSPTAVATPQIKVSLKDSFEKNVNYVKSDSAKVVFKEKIDVLIEIYDALLKNNLILSLISEIYFLICILLSKQIEDDYITAEINLNNNNFDFLMKSIHNSTYFAVKSLWAQRVALEVILDKNSLKILGENKKIRSFYPDLAKFLLNSYGLKCEAENNLERRTVAECRSSNGVICFNFETDNVDNFPSVTSFQNFKKQRDMFYQILRWYQETQTYGGSRTTFRARIKTLLTCGQSPANYAHLAALFTAHMLAECLPHNTQESKLSKLQRRLTCPTAPESHRLPYFSAKELFYKEFIMYTENEPFRVHLKDAIASEILVLDSSPIAADDRGNANTSDISKEYLHLSKKLALLSKFLGFLTSLPYTHVPVDSSKSVATVRGQKEPNAAPPKEKVLENNIALRNYSQPIVDLNELLMNALKNSRISITLPWLIHYLSQLDYTTLRIKYYRKLLKIIFNIYTDKLKLTTDNTMKKNTVIYLKSILGWLFDLPHFPIELFYEKNVEISVASEVNIDCYDIIDESMLFELCPFLRDVNVLLSTCRVSHDQKEMGSFRHITPVSLGFNSEDRMRNKEKELQARLEEEFLKSQPSSCRRVLELVVERVAAGCVRELAAKPLPAARERARARAAAALRAAGAGTGACLYARGTRQCEQLQPELLQSVRAAYAAELAALRSDALQSAGGKVRARAAAALQALLPAAASPQALQALQALAARGCLARLHKWIDDNWTTTAILCKDIEAEMKTLMVLSECNLNGGSRPSTTPDLRALTISTAQFEAVNVSPAAVIIQMKVSPEICYSYTDFQRVFFRSPLSAGGGRVAAAGRPPPESAALATLAWRGAAAAAPGNVFARPHAARALLQLSLELCALLVSPARPPAGPPPPGPRAPLLQLSLELCALLGECPPPGPPPDPRPRAPAPRCCSSASSCARCSVSDPRPAPAGPPPPGPRAPLLQLSLELCALLGECPPPGPPPDPRPRAPAPRCCSSASSCARCSVSDPRPAPRRTPAPGPPRSAAAAQPRAVRAARKKPKEITDSLLNKLYAIWHNCCPDRKKYLREDDLPDRRDISPEPRNFEDDRAPTPVSDDDEKVTPAVVIPTETAHKPVKTEESSTPEDNKELEMLEFFDRVLCPRNIMIFSDTKCPQADVWEALASLLVFLLQKDFLSEDSLTEQCLAVYRQDWPQSVLENLSTCMKSVSSRWSRSSTGKFTLFLDFLAEYCGDMDYESME
ncbi:codanin-1 like protein dlt [Aphomia sociella]